MAREDGGRVVFVAGALPGEVVEAEVVDERRSFARAVAVDILEPSPDRITPPCPNVAAGCGGCDWQHVSVEAQRRLRRQLVEEVLRRQGSVTEPVVRPGPVVAAETVRTTVRGRAGADGRFAFRRRRSHDLVEVGSCLVAHPLVEEVVAEGRFPGAGEIVVRAGSRTGERLVVVDRDAHAVVVPPGVSVVDRRSLGRGRRAWLHEEAAGRRWRLSAGSFFQASPEGAEALVQSARGLLAALDPPAGPLVDLCCGVGLFAGTLAGDRPVHGVERSASAVADARVNLADLRAQVTKVALARWRPAAASVVVADPSRAGLGPEGTAAVAATRAEACLLVSCDPAALGRDTALLARAGYRHVASDVVDLFGHTSHVEVVSGFRRLPAAGTDRR